MKKIINMINHMYKFIEFIQKFIYIYIHIYLKIRNSLTI